MTDKSASETAPADNDKTITIQSESFTISTPYSEGHAITAVEARVLNQTWLENIANSQRKTIKEAKEEGTFDLKVARKAVADYAAEYSFATGGPAVRRTLDPIQKEARAIARNLIAAKLKDAGKKMKDQDKAKLATAVDQWAEHPKVIAAATKVVKEREELANLSLDAA